MKDTGQIFDPLTVKRMTGIQVNMDYQYQLVELTVNDVIISGYTEEALDILKPIVTPMVNHLKLGGTFAPLILFDNMNIADGQHRMAAYILNNTKSFYGLIKRKYDGK